MKAALIILTHNQKEKTLRCLESCRYINGIDHKIFLWDNGSADGVLEIVSAEYTEVKLYRSEKNIGVASARNACAKEALKFSPDYLLFLDNDTIVDRNFLYHLINGLSGSHYAIVSPKIKIMNDHNYLYGAGSLNVIFRKGKTQHLGYNELDKGQYDTVIDPIPSGGCFLVRSEVFKELNGFDEIFSPYGPEDIDFVFRAKALGYRTKYIPEAVIYHESKPAKTAQKLFRYSLRRLYHWLIILNRHATKSDILAFLFLYGPFFSAKQVLTKFRTN